MREFKVGQVVRVGTTGVKGVLDQFSADGLSVYIRPNGLNGTFHILVSDLDSRPINLIKAAFNILQDYTDNSDLGCDHSVGLCACSLRDMLSTLAGTICEEIGPDAVNVYSWNEMIGYDVDITGLKELVEKL